MQKSYQPIVPASLGKLDTKKISFLAIWPTTNIIFFLKKV
jgi:hypothetical protein